MTGNWSVTGATVTTGGAPATDAAVTGATSITAKTPAGTLGPPDVVVVETDAGTTTLAGLLALSGFASLCRGGRSAGSGLCSAVRRRPRPKFTEVRPDPPGAAGKRAGACLARAAEED